MIKKLRHKFIIINMLFVFVVLVIVFVIVLASYSQTLTTDIHRSLTQAVEDRVKVPKMEPDDSSTPIKDDVAVSREKIPKFIAIYAFIMDENGYPTKTLQPSSLIDDSDINDIALLVSKAEYEEVGVLNEYNLYYYRHRLASGNSAVSLADAGYYYNSMTTMLFYSFAIIALSLIAFFFISLFLSKWALKPVEKAWTQQKQFIADASHELKTPLTVILANIKILLKKKDSKIDEQLQWIESTEEEAENMKKLVESLLFLARSDAESEQTVVLSEDINLSELTETAALQFEPVAYERHITLNSSIEENIMIKGDSSQLKQLVQIFLDNACKYTPTDGNILISLKKNQMSVFNSGTPIPKENLPHIFERFYRSDKARSDPSSFGLGLSIAKRIALNHGGDLSAESSNEIGGTKFTFTFPQI